MIALYIIELLKNIYISSLYIYNYKTKTLTIPYTFNKKLKYIPKDTKNIIFEDKYEIFEYSKFNQKVDDLPPSLTHLTFGYYFNQKVDNLPQNLTYLTFRTESSFNQTINNLPKNLTFLTFSDYFNQKVDKLPKNLTHLTFGNDFDQKVDKLPKNITYLSFKNPYKFTSIRSWVLYRSQCSSDFNQKVDKLPKSLTHLNFAISKIKNIKSEFNQKVDNLPQSLTHLVFGSEFNQKVDNLPKNLTCLIFGCHFNQKIDKLPKNITYLGIGFCSNQKLYYKLPKNLVYLESTNDLCQSEIILPKKLKELVLDCNNNLINNIPQHVEKIYICFDNTDIFSRPKKIENLPFTLKEIIIEDEKYKEYIRIPFGTILTIKNIE